MKRILKSLSKLAKKRFGQHFLSDVFIVAKIMQAINPQEQQCIIEIGPGCGALTNDLIASNAEIYAIELDRDLCTILQNKYLHANNFVLHNLDALQFSFSQLELDTTKELLVVGNLPYNISTPLLFKLFAEHQQHKISRMVFMLQSEVAARLVAPPGSKTYGKLSVMAQYYCNITELFAVPPTCFTPPPQVDSTIVELVPKTERAKTDVDRLQQVVTAAFSQRRKKLHNALKNYLSREQIQALNIDPNLRAEQLSIEDFIAIANCSDFSGEKI